MAKKAKSAKSEKEDPNGSGDVVIDSERLQLCREVEATIEASRLSYEEAKAKHVMAKAEYRLLVAKRNLIIAKATEPVEVEDAQRLVDNARNRETKAKSIRDSARDEWKGAEERLAKALTEKLPLFD